jgi:CheY-like chemotaxis protein
MMTRVDLQANPAADAPCEPDEWLPKPIRQARLREAIDRAVGRLSRDQNADDNHSVSLRALGMRVLLVEDSPVNTEVALGMLESLGCTVITAINGQYGVEHALGERFDVVLMDCQMPLMDGYEATRAIRAGESERGRQPVPIVAITANALPGDRERCLDAGMTDFISKPFTIRKLATVLRGVAEPGSILPEGGSEPRADSRPVASLPVIEIGQIEELRSLGRPQLVRRTILMFLKQAAEKLSTLDAALHANDMAAVEQAAHSLKSASLNVGGRRFAAAAGNCETVARQAGPEAVRKAAKLLRPEFSKLCQALSSLLEAEPEGKVA